MSYYGSVAVRASDFRVGEWVVRYDSIFPGKVVAVHPGINLVDVEYQTGWEQNEPEELIKITLFGVVPSSHSAKTRNRGSAKVKNRLRKFVNILRRVHTENNPLSYSTETFTDASPLNIVNAFIKKSYIKSTAGTQVMRPSLTHEGRLFILGDAFQKASGATRSKIAKQIVDNYSQVEWDAYKQASAILIDPTKLPTYAKRAFHTKDGKYMRIVANPQLKKFQLLLDNKVIKQSSRLKDVNKMFRRIKRKDQNSWS